MEPHSPEESLRGAPSHNVAKGILVAVALVLAYFLYQNIIVRAPSSQDTEKSFNFRPLSDNEREALNAPPVFTGKADGMFHKNTGDMLRVSSPLVEKIAVVTNTLAIGADCRVSPVVIKVKKGATMKLKNYDTISHTIIFGLTHSFPVSAQGSADITANFGEIGAVYAFGCESNPWAIGMLWLAE